MTKQTSPSTPARTTYTSFYLVMLIITTIGVASSAWGVFEVFNLFAYFSAAPLYASLMLTSLALLPVSIAALILLYQKLKPGLVLLLVSLAIDFVIALALLFCTDQMISYTLATSSPQDIDGSGGIEFFTTFMTIVWYAALIIGNTLILAAAILWHFAWRNQLAADKKQKA